MSSHGSRVPGRLFLLIAVAVSAAFALAAPDVRADPIDLSACNTSPLTRPFAPWGDLASYELARGGDFENATWTLSGSAGRARGSEPYAAAGRLGSPSGKRTLQSVFPVSGSSPATCSGR